MSYIYRCGCVGDNSETCPRHRVGFIVQSSSDPNSTEKDKYKTGSVNLLLSGSNAKINTKFNLAFFPTVVGIEPNTVESPFREHKIVFDMLDESKHQGVLMCEQADLASNLISLLLLGIDMADIQIMTSLRTYDIKSVGGVHEDFFGYIIVFGNHAMDRLPKSCVHLGSLCLFERTLIQQDWITKVLDYNATSPRTYLAANDLNKTICIKTKYRELFNMIKCGSVSFQMLQCEIEQIG